MGPVRTNFTPYVVHIRVVPVVASGRRFEMYRHLEKKANETEHALVTAGLRMAVPVGFTLPFRQAPARITVVGFDPNARGTVAPVTPTAKIIHSGTVEGEKTAVKTPPQGTQSWGDAPIAAIDTAVKSLKLVIEAALVLSTHPVRGSVVYIEYNGVKYGTLFNQKAFRSFPR